MISLMNPVLIACCATSLAHSATAHSTRARVRNRRNSSPTLQPCRCARLEWGKNKKIRLVVALSSSWRDLAPTTCAVCVLERVSHPEMSHSSKTNAINVILNPIKCYRNAINLINLPTRPVRGILSLIKHLISEHNVSWSGSRLALCSVARRRSILLQHIYMLIRELRWHRDLFSRETFEAVVYRKRTRIHFQTCCCL